MRIRFLRSIASFDFCYHTGQVADIEDALARAWVASGIAEAETVPEAAMVTVPANAMQRKPRGRR